MHVYNVSHHGWLPGVWTNEAVFAWWDKVEWCHTWALVHGTHEVSICGRSLRVWVWRWPPDGWTVKRFMDERWRACGTGNREKGRFAYGQLLSDCFPWMFWPKRWGISPVDSSSVHTHWDEAGGLICPVCASLLKAFMNKGKAEALERLSTSRCLHKRYWGHYTVVFCFTHLILRQSFQKHTSASDIYRKLIGAPSRKEPWAYSKDDHESRCAFNKSSSNLYLRQQTPIP